MDVMDRPALDREVLLARYARNRVRSRELFDRIAPEAYEQRAIVLRHPPAFYEGHIPDFSFLSLVRDALHRPSIDPELERFFQRGIDPGDVATADRLQRTAYPSRDQILAFAAECDARVMDALRSAPLDDTAEPRLRDAQAAWMILEHEEMHHETLCYLMHRIALGRKHGPAGTSAGLVDRPAPEARTVEIPSGTATLGASSASGRFGWDNEFEETQVRVGRFECDVYPVTNAEWLAFVRDGGPTPPFWIPGEGGFDLLAQFESLPLPMSWPVYVTNEQARAYAEWRGRRVMTEAEYHRAAFGTPYGVERTHPWGDAPPSARFGNFDWRRWDPEPVGSAPHGASAFGVHELVGNGWEHTSTPFAPLPGFEPMASYPQYSHDFFDGRHYIVKGASPVTAREHVRRSLRNWYYGDYPYMYAKFRTVRS